ncbi:MAG: ATP-binding protein [Gemmatimonadales bacterium]
MNRPSDRLRALPVRIALLVGLALAVLLPGGLWLERVLSDRLIESRVADLRASLVREVAAGAASVSLGEARLSRLAELLEGEVDRDDPRDAAAFDQATRRAPDGTVRMARRLEPSRDAVLWVPSHHPLDRFWKGLLLRGQTLVSQVGAATAADTMENTWFMTPRGAEIMYSPSSPDYADRPAPEGYDVSSWIDPVTPEANPEGRPRWLSAQASVLPPPRWFATLVAPVMRRGALVGVVGHDYSIAGAFIDFTRFPPGPGRAYLIVAEGGLIAYGSGGEFGRAQTDSIGIATFPSPLRDSLAALVGRTRAAAPGSVTGGSVGTRIMLASRLAAPDWTVVALIERAAVVAPLQAPLRLMRLGLAAVLSLLLIAILAAVATDVRRQRTVGEVKARASERFNRLFQMLPVTVALTRTDTGEVIEANDAASRLTGLPRDQLVGKTTADLGLWSNPAERDQVRRMIQEQGFVADYASRFTLPGGKQIDILMAARVVDVDGVSHMLTVIQDLSVQRQLEAQLVQSQKLEAVGRLAGGVAHDFNNLLTAVIGYGELLNATLTESDERRDDVGEILNAARRGATLTRQLLGFARQQNAAPRVVNVNDVVRGIERMLKPLIGEDVTITSDLDPAIGTVMIDPGQLEQVITNLAVNARDAMTGGGTLTLRTSDNGVEVCLEVTDTGAGIPDDVKAHIFEPFFTTKDVGKGTGLGLATCYGIVRQAGGTIRCDSTIGRGTTFRVMLPRLGQRADRLASDPKGSLPAVTGVRRILVVEDDDMVRAITTAILEDGGYQVVAREGPSPALAYLLEGADPIDLVVSDIVMPRMSGPAFGRVLATTHPALPMLFISGYNPDEATRNDLSGLGHPFLAKPFSREDLLRAVAHGLRDSSAVRSQPAVV